MMPVDQIYPRGVSSVKPMKAPPLYLSEADQKALLNRVSRVEGQVRALKSSILEGACADDLIRLASASRGALRQIVALLLETHLVECATTCMEGDQEEVLRRVAQAVSTAMRQA